MNTNKTFHMDKAMRTMLAGMHYDFNAKRLKVYTNAYRFRVYMTKDGYRVTGANKQVVVNSFSDVLIHIKSHG